MNCAALLPILLAPVLAAQQALTGVDAVIEQAIQQGQIPGAVLLVSHQGGVVYRKAYGRRAVEPRSEEMTVDTIFDAASLTKVVATTPVVMKLVEEGKLRLNDRVTQYLAEFQGGASEITVRQLLTHFSGLRPDLDLEPAWSGYETGIRKALADKPVAAPGERFQYSDINFILLGEIIQRLRGKPLADCAAEVVFKPLGMERTTFRPPEEWLGRIAPTDSLRGVVHDPTARAMGGVAGHAGVFTTADDLARFADMMLGLGARGEVRLFSPLTVRLFTSPQSPPGQRILRGLGWDIDSPYSSPRGELFPIGSYGHTGFTGTSLWIDPASRSYVILLTNSVHFKSGSSIVSLRSRVATVVAAALGAADRNAQVLTGLDALEQQRFAPLAGKRVGLITNQTGLDRQGRRNVDVMLQAGVKLVALFSPEHGLAGAQDSPSVAHTKDASTGIPVWSLYMGENRRPSGEMLANLDALVFDIQDVGVRFYTYISTMGYAMEEAARHHLAFYVLDRPNPLNGVRVEGPMLDQDLVSFVGYFPLPLRHGMSVGELAGMFNEENHLGVDLHVVPMDNWQRGDWFDSTGLVWVNPSPNIRSLQAALLYPGVAMLEGSPGYSVGRGTDAPFEQIGAAWINGRELAAHLNARGVPGVRFYPMLEGVRFLVTDREAFSSQRLGLEIAAALERLYPGKIPLEANSRLIGSREVIDALAAGSNPEEIEQLGEDKLQQFLRMRDKYLLYR